MLQFIETHYSDYDFESFKNSIILISHYYNLNEHKSTYKFSINRSGRGGTMYDIMKGEEYIKYRNEAMEDLGGEYSENELLDKIKKMSYYLSDDFYKEWEMEQNVKKYKDRKSVV